MAARLAIVGAGAKAAAIVARAAVLRGLGVPDVPELLVLEADHVGAAWSGRGQFSSGFLTLCTPAEKDVGFPYTELIPRGTSAPVAPALFARFSWSAFLVAQGLLSEWVDRGRDHPRHADWAAYLGWVLDTAGQSVVNAKVTAIRPAAGKWEVSFQRDKRLRPGQVDGVVLTGAGRARAVPFAGPVPPGRVFDSETFWAARHAISRLGRHGAIAVVGDGGAAGTIVAWLAERFAERDVAIYSINPMGTLFPRGDGHAERRWFSDPSEWRELSLPHRRALLARTEAGVVSMRNKQIIDRSLRIAYRWGRAVEASRNGDEIEVAIEYEGQPAVPQRADYLVSAIGFEMWSLLELVDDPAVAALCAPAGAPARIQVEVDMLPDLSLPPVSGLPPGLHVPALGALAHGPGMGNLGCLGLMAAAVLKPYIGKRPR
jgi:mycobactin lysine-N-oxygenase